ncbi:MAG: EAL domain-containing protein [Sulfurimonas sp.]|nr:EAL domain-containing protein [Sulfurimonas sp.]
MISKKWLLLLLPVIIGGMLLSYYRYSNLPVHIAESESTVMQTDAIGFTYKVLTLLQKSYITLTQAIAHQNEDKLYDAVDYVEAAEGFLNTKYLKNDALIKKIRPLIEKSYKTVESSGLSITQEQLDEICDDYASIKIEIEQVVKELRLNVQKEYIEFQENEYKLNILYELIILSISLMLFAFIWMLIKQRQLNRLVLSHKEELTHLAYYDSLTKIPNRKSIENIISENIERFKRNGTEFYVAMIDLDNFKNINDIYGHDVGDLVLIESVKRIKSCIRTLDTLGRFGGDEFIIILEDKKNLLELTTILNRINDSFKKPMKINNVVYYTTVSIGVVNYPNDANSVWELIKHADIAMYHSKSQGKAQYNFFESRLGTMMQRQHEMEPQIQKALQEEEFELYYQSQIDIASNRILSAEALVRWRHPERGLIFPGDFIDIIENGYLTKEFGEWVISEASKQQKIWLERGIKLSISVNLSVKHIMEPNFYDDMLALVLKLNIDLKYFHFEITEYELLSHRERSAKVLNDLAKEGFSFHLDDFGTGYSSITYLNQLDIATVKIDKSFIDKIVSKSDKYPFVDAIVDMAKALGIRVIAEGVETEVQYEYLKEIHCETIQGYYYSKPLAVDDFERYFKEQRDI